MNENLPSHTSTSSSQGVSAEAISRRAYEIWEREGRPEGCDLRHWLQAEQELGVQHAEPTTQSKNGGAHASEQPGTLRGGNVDTRPLQQPTRAPASSSQKRPATPSTSGEKTGGTGGGQSTAKRKPSNAPIL